MGIFQWLIDLMNAIIGILNSILDFIEKLFGPLLDLIARWNSLFGIL